MKGENQKKGEKKMGLSINEGKKIEIQVGNEIYKRYAIRTHYVRIGEKYLDIIEKYAKPYYKEGDILSISEKMIALCQKRVILKKNIKISKTANFLSRFVHVTPAGEAVGNPYKMQIAIMLCGKMKVIWAAILAGIGKLFHKKGIFYQILGKEVAGIDGFCGDAFQDYLEMGILIPENPKAVCEEIENKLKMKVIIVDANDLNVEILGKSPSILYTDTKLKQIIKDNPTGQGSQQTPILLIRKKCDIL
ncbi:MAG: coenzyme F420-0:L-glutamate ligase [Clostridia bacterium]